MTDPSRRPGAGWGSGDETTGVRRWVKVTVIVAAVVVLLVVVWLLIGGGGGEHGPGRHG